jgi:NAD+ kinase
MKKNQKSKASQRFHKIGLIARNGIPRGVEYAKIVENFAKNYSAQLLPDFESAKLLKLTNSYQLTEIVNSADPVIVLGGDGTLIGAAHSVNSASPTLLGVHFGHLGFLTEVTPSELKQALSNFATSKAKLQERYMLEAKVIRDGKVIFKEKGINDSVIQKGAKSPLLTIDCEVNHEPLMKLRADGLITATSTGSTAYSLAAGGSIVHPELPALLVTPICPHSLTVRPLVVPFDYSLKITIPECRGEAVLAVDGQLFCDILAGDQIVIVRSSSKIRFVSSPTRSYFEILRGKLNWGIGKET